MKKINKITIEKIIDDNPQLDYLGKFSDTLGKFAIETNAGNNGYKYFNAENVENMKQAKENYKRIMQYENGNLCDYGVKATAEIYTLLYEDKTSGKNWLINKITSGGIWGLSSDGTDEYFQSEADGQLDELKDVLKEFDFSDEEINKATLINNV